MAYKFNLTSAQGTTGFVREQIYGSLDTIATLQIDDYLEAQMTEADKRAHDFYMAIMGPAMEMSMRGILVDPVSKDKQIRELQAKMRRIVSDIRKHKEITSVWDRIELNSGACPSPKRKDGKHSWPRAKKDEPAIPDKDKRCEACGASRQKIRPFSPGSDQDVPHLLYDLWRLKPVTNKDGKITADKEARERTRDKLKANQKQYDEPIRLIDEYADTEKQLGFFKFRSDDGRFHSNFNVGVTSTHRWSSNQDNYGRGSNAQNVTEAHRHNFVADPGYELCYADLKQAESKVISFVAGDEGYIEAHEGGDTHTFVCRLVWPEGINGQQWTGDLGKDKVIATSARPPWDDREGHDYRFQSKAVQHGSNLGLTPYGMAIQKRIPVSAASEGQARYFKAFPGIGGYQRMIRDHVQNQEPIVTPLGISFKLFGRPWDEGTYKEGLAVIPQSMVGHIISIGCYRIWTQQPEVQLLAQVHDAILFQFPKGRYDIVHKSLQLMEVPIPITGIDSKLRVMTIGTEAAVGHNWGHSKWDHNPDGLKEIVFSSATEWKIK